MNYIYRLYTNKTVGVFTNKDDAISLLFHIPNSKIEVFNNLTPIGIYSLNKNNLLFNNNPVELEGYMKVWFNTPNKPINEELNVFIPMSEPVNRANSGFAELPVQEKKQEPLNIESLAEKIKRLEEEAKLMEEKANEIKEVVEENENKYKEKAKNYDEEKKRLAREKDRWNQFKTKLEADKRVYCIIKEQLESGELNEGEIPVLFQDKYPIFKYMHEHNLISLSDVLHPAEIDRYVEILNNPPLEIVTANQNITTNIDTKNYSELFSSSDPIYNFKKNVESEVDTNTD
jgi:flagellar hook protein FlgE